MRRRYVLVPLLSLIVVINLLEEDKQQKEDPFTVPVDSDELPDYYMEQMVLKHYDENGILQAEISSPILSHYANQRQALMVEPVITLFGVNNQIWQLTSLEGRIFDQTQDIALKDNVNIKLGRSGEEQLQLVTQQLFYEFNAHRASSQTEVAFENSLAVGSASGLLIDLNTELFELHKNVEIRFND